MLEAAGLECVRGERRLFRNLNFKVEPGSLLEVRGANGSGKTSLLRILCGLLSPTDGEVLWRGVKVRSLKEEYAGAIVYLGHLSGIKDELSALENLRFASMLVGNRVKEEELRAALSRMGLSGFEMLPAKVLSQGQRRRTALARLAISRKPLWILDEPLTALDASATALVESLLAEHLQSGGMTVLATHQALTVKGANFQTVTLSE